MLFKIRFLEKNYLYYLPKSAFIKIYWKNIHKIYKNLALQYFTDFHSNLNKYFQNIERNFKKCHIISNSYEMSQNSSLIKKRANISIGNEQTNYR